MNSHARRIRILVLLAIISCPAFAGAAAISSSINSGQKLVINFNFSSPPTTANGGVDFFQMNYGASFTDFNWSAGSYVEASLYNGNTLLGTRTLTSSTDGCCIYVQPGSPGTSLATTNIDMTSIQNGTIDGTLIYTPYFVNPGQYSNVYLSWSLLTGKYVSYGTYWPGTPDPTISSYAVISAVPLPSAMWLLSSFGLLGLIDIARKRKAG